MIQVANLSKKFGKLRVLQSVDASFAMNRSYALIGRNGSGKTTLVKSILGMNIPDSGTITVADGSIRGSWSYRERIGYMPQIGHFPGQMRMGELFDMICDLRPATGNRDEDLITAFGLDTMRDKRMHTLSGGTIQKVSASIAFLFCPDILILDEPTAGLDPIAVEVLKEKILAERSKEKCFIITSHVMSDLDELCTDVVFLEDGKILYNDSIDQLKEDTGELRLGKAVATIMKRNVKTEKAKVW